MALSDREKWDARYLKDPRGSEPSKILIGYCDLAAVGNALDIACGNGRNSVYLAKKGFTVDAVDISTVATGQLAGKHPNIDVICTDLDTWIIPPNRYELIVNIRFLDRHLFPMIQEGLKPGGVLIVENFIDENMHQYCLRPNELLHAFGAFRVVHYEEQRIDPPEKFAQIASLVALKPG